MSFCRTLEWFWAGLWSDCPSVGFRPDGLRCLFAFRHLIKRTSGRPRDSLCLLFCSLTDASTSTGPLKIFGSRYRSNSGCSGGTALNLDSTARAFGRSWLFGCRWFFSFDVTFWLSGSASGECERSEDGKGEDFSHGNSLAVPQGNLLLIIIVARLWCSESASDSWIGG